MIKAPIKRDKCKFQSITQSENTKTLQKKNRLWYFFQFTSLTAGDVIEISQTKQQVSAPIQPPNTPPPLSPRSTSFSTRDLLSL